MAVEAHDRFGKTGATVQATVNLADGLEVITVSNITAAAFRAAFNRSEAVGCFEDTRAREVVGEWNRM